MLNIDSLERGLVIDHIEAGKSMEIYKFLKLDKLDCSVAIIKNARSKKTGKKDIIKIEDQMDIDLDVLGFIDPNITVNVIDGAKQVVNVVRCKNPRCITSIEQELPQVFNLVEGAGREHPVYRCAYCEQEYSPNK